MIELTDEMVEADVEGRVHFLVWQRFRMACGRKPGESYSSASFWERVNCPDCLEQQVANADGKT